MSERKLRRALYWITAGMWALSLTIAVHAVVTESLMSRTVLLFVLGMTMCLTTAALFAVFVAPLERVYRHGYEAGQHAADCQRHPDLRMVAGERAKQVVQLRGRNN